MSDTVWMTQEALQRLENELRELTGPDRAGREDDQARIVQLRDVIRRAEVSTKPDDGLVEPGMKISVDFGGADGRETFLLGDRALIGSDDDLSVYSPDSPLGQAISNRRVGETLSYTAPNGKPIEVTISAAVPYA